MNRVVERLAGAPAVGVVVVHGGGGSEGRRRGCAPARRGGQSSVAPPPPLSPLSRSCARALRGIRTQDVAIRRIACAPRAPACLGSENDRGWARATVGEQRASAQGGASERPRPCVYSQAYASKGARRCVLVKRRWVCVCVRGSFGGFVCPGSRVRARTKVGATRRRARRGAETPPTRRTRRDPQKSSSTRLPLLSHTPHHPPAQFHTRTRQHISEPRTNRPNHCLSLRRRGGRRKA